jgi:hypothetical protein
VWSSVDEAYGSIGEAQHGFSESADGSVFIESLNFHPNLVYIACQYIFIVICGPGTQ